jgi:hypothetical protein
LIASERRVRGAKTGYLVGTLAGLLLLSRSFRNDTPLVSDVSNESGAFEKKKGPKF